MCLICETLLAILNAKYKMMGVVDEHQNLAKIKSSSRAYKQHTMRAPEKNVMRLFSKLYEFHQLTDVKKVPAFK
jgi:aspartyl/asparaginyl beta-hydroxylase (cupin superfamily)